MAIRKRRANNWDRPKYVPTCAECEPTRECCFYDDYQWICTACGLVSKETGDDPQHPDYSETQTVVRRSHHQPCKYVITVIHKYNIDPRLTPEISKLFQSIQHAAEVTKPDDRKNLPSYNYVLRRILLRLGREDQAAKVKQRKHEPPTDGMSRYLYRAFARSVATGPANRNNRLHGPHPSPDYPCPVTQRQAENSRMTCSQRKEGASETRRLVPITHRLAA